MQWIWQVLTLAFQLTELLATVVLPILGGGLILGGTCAFLYGGVNAGTGRCT